MPLAELTIMMCVKLIQALFHQTCFRSVLWHHTPRLLTVASLDQLFLESAAFVCAQELFELPQQPSGQVRKASGQVQKPQGRCEKPPGKCGKPQGKRICD